VTFTSEQKRAVVLKQKAGVQLAAKAGRTVGERPARRAREYRPEGSPLSAAPAKSGMGKTSIDKGPCLFKNAQRVGAIRMVLFGMEFSKSRQGDTACGAAFSTVEDSCPKLCKARS
jgi:hypothetical protein